MSTVYADATTVFGDDQDTFTDGFKPSTSSIKPKDLDHRQAGAGLGKSAQPKLVNDFIATTDYTLEERPFFFPIGKDGVIAALEKLDKQLVQVWFTYYVMS
ncbi:hypothetical protein C0989_007807 [Termitomyces sp. Mn162]|nr:hypothetical protein C0989_007807 [Termitomyces sp. Mn162]